MLRQSFKYMTQHSRCCRELSNFFVDDSRSIYFHAFSPQFYYGIWFWTILPNLGNRYVNRVRIVISTSSAVGYNKFRRFCLIFFYRHTFRFICRYIAMCYGFFNHILAIVQTFNGNGLASFDRPARLVSVFVCYDNSEFQGCVYSNRRRR